MAITVIDWVVSSNLPRLYTTHTHILYIYKERGKLKRIM